MSEIDKLRQHIDEIDSQIIELISQRKYWTQKIGKYKKDNNLPIIDKSREKEVLDLAIREGREHDLDPKMLQNVFKLIINNSRGTQFDLK